MTSLIYSIMVIAQALTMLFSQPASYTPPYKVYSALLTQSGTNAPTFTNLAGGDYSPLNGSSPQVGAGTPITIANGYWMDITTDYFGNPRDATNPTIGAIEYVP